MFTNVDHGQIAHEILQNRKINGLEQDLDKANQTILNQNNTISKLKQELTNMDQQVDDLREQCNKLRSRRESLKQELTNMDQQVDDLREQRNKCRHKRDKWQLSKEISEAVLAARSKQFFLVLCLVHSTNPRLFNDPQKRIHKKLDYKGEDGLTDYLKSKYRHTRMGYQLRSNWFINPSYQKSWFTDSFLERDLNKTIQNMESRKPIWFDQLYKFWPPMEIY